MPKPKSNFVVNLARIKFEQFWLWLLLAIMAFKVPSDPDLGWHLQNGYHTIANWWPQQGDIYSWTMPNYPWVSHEWLTEVLMATINSLSGLWGLAICFAIVIAIIFWLAAGVTKSDRQYAPLIALIGLLASWPILGSRPQMLTLLGIVVVLRLLFLWRETRNPHLLWWFPIVFAVWANLHAGFAGGFLVLAVFGFAEIIRHLLVRNPKIADAPVLQWREILQLIGMAVVSLCATLVNPYGWKIYHELWMTLSQTAILDNIAEWLPVNLASQSSLNLLLMLSIIIGVLCWNKFKVDYTKLLLAVVFWLVAISSWRHLPLFAIVSLPLLAEQLTPILGYTLASIFRYSATRVVLIMIIGLVGWWQIYQNQLTISDPITYAQVNQLPYSAVQYLKTHPTPEKLFNEYNWGGYLIWQLPDTKVFIDGRMAIWKTSQVAIFSEFQKFMGNHTGTIVQALNQWDIDTVLVYPNRPINAVLAQFPNTWQKVFADKQAIVWRRIVDVKSSVETEALLGDN
ncbi:MAG: hypothetical protein WC553_00115 [Patescibacteria group bacterium]